MIMIKVHRLKLVQNSTEPHWQQHSSLTCCIGSYSSSESKSLSSSSPSMSAMMVAKFCLFMDVLRKLAGVLRWCKLILIYAGWSFCVLFSFYFDWRGHGAISPRKSKIGYQVRTEALPLITNAHRRRNPGSPS
jgi:hypothetical protein